jgi:multiple sugar transport system ATP-binding protein
MTDIRLQEVRKVYANGVVALDGVTLTVPADQCLALVGPSGCGKTTLLRVIAGLEQSSSGTVRLGAQVVNSISAERRDVAMLFQRPALVPGKSVRENLAWAWTLAQRGPVNLLRNVLGRPARTAAQERDIEEVACLLGIDQLLGRPAGELSGGQQQRVALGRTLLRRASVCLLDEPLGHLEAALRTQLRRDLSLLSRRFPATIVHVTHDPAEALAVGDQVAILHEGRLQQIGAPAAVLRRPANRFVAEFCRPQGPLNLLFGRLEDGKFIAAPWLRMAVPQAALPRLPCGADVTVGIDSEEIKITPTGAAADPVGHIMRMDVMLTEFAPRGLWVTCRRDGVQLTGLSTQDCVAAIGSTAMVAMSLENAFWFDCGTGATLAGPAG